MTGAGNVADIAASLNKSFETPRLRIQPLLSSHADAAFALLQDERIYRWISMNKPASVESLRADWKRNEARMSPDGEEAWLAWFVTSKADGSPVGSVDACINSDSIATNFGYYFFAGVWGQGFASEAVKAVADALISHGVPMLVATVTAGNAASARVLQKCDFKFNRIIPANDILHSVLVDDEEYVRTCAR